MPMGLGLGPVFGNEWLTTSRRWQVYAARSLFVAALLVGLWSVWADNISVQNVPTIQLMADVGFGFFRAIVFTQLTLVLMVAPAATAGAICQDRSSGKLAQLLATDLSDIEIVLGKLAARLVPVAGLVGCTLPVLALSALLGGVDPLALGGTFLVTASLAIFGCTLALTFSVWASKPYEVLLATYAVFGLWMLAVPVWDFLAFCWRYPTSPGWAIPLNPFHLACAPYMQPGRVGAVGFLVFFLGVLIASAGLAAIGISRMRVVSVGSDGHPGLRNRAVDILSRASLARRFGIRLAPSLDGNPVLWYETRHRQPSSWIKTMIRGYFALSVVFSLIAIDDSLRQGSIIPGWLSAYVVAFQVAIGLPLVLISAATSVVEERARGSLDLLLATPLATRHIVLAKWWGAFRELRRLQLPALVAIAAAWPMGNWILAVWLALLVLSAAALWASVGLAVSTWVPRLGRAVALAVALYTLVGLVWPILTMTLFPREASALSAISPFYGSFDLTLGLCQPGHVANWFGWIPCWIASQTVVAGVLLLATLATFDRASGRIRG
jgi:ABC-type transport system involved in multi-copper enzyme maturation permease subunit